MRKRIAHSLVAPQRLAFWFRRLPPRGEQQHRRRYFGDGSGRWFLVPPVERTSAGNLRTFMQLAEEVGNDGFVA